MHLDIEAIKAELTKRSLDEIQKVKVVRKGKIKRVKKAGNDAQKQRLTGQSKQSRRRSAIKTQKTKKKKGGEKSRTKMKRKRSNKIRDRIGG